MLPSDTDQKACADTDGLLMTGHKAIVVSRFQIPTKTVFAVGPEHEVSGDLTRDGVGCCSMLPKVDPLWPDSQHELGFRRQRPRFLEQKICIPFGGVPREEGRDASLDFQPILDRSGFCREVGAKLAAPPVVVQLVAAPSSRMTLGSSSSGAALCPAAWAHEVEATENASKSVSLLMQRC